MPAASRPDWRLWVLGLPLLVLVFAGIAVTAFLAVNLVLSGAREGRVGDLLLGATLGALWILMAVKTARARRQASSN